MSLDGPNFININKVMEKTQPDSMIDSGTYNFSQERQVGMAVKLLMPKLGLNMVEGQVTEWKKKEGDWLRKVKRLYRGNR